MTRYERKLFFERLVALRDAYALERQVTVDLTIGSAEVFARAMYDVLAGAEREQEPAHASGAATTEMPAD